MRKEEGRRRNRGWGGTGRHGRKDFGFFDEENTSVVRCACVLSSPSSHCAHRFPELEHANCVLRDCPRICLQRLVVDLSGRCTAMWIVRAFD